jgi:hypothetical protein
MIRWTHVGTSGAYDRTAGYEFRSRTGKFYTRTVSGYSGVSITRWPSEAYYLRASFGQNKGTRARSWTRN